MAYTIDEILRLDSIADLDMIFDREDTGSDRGAWRIDSGGTTESSNTGPGTNSVGRYVYSEASGVGLSIFIQENSKLTVKSSVMTQWVGTNRAMLFRAAIQGNGWVDTGEGLQIRGRASSSDTWVEIILIQGWSYSDNYTIGDIITDAAGDQLVCAQDGGWVDFQVAIPDTYTEVQIRSLPIGGSSDLFEHDVALYSIQLPEVLFAMAIPDMMMEGGIYFSHQFGTASGGSGIYTYAVTGALPRGLTFTLSTRTLAGRPLELGTFGLTYLVTDSSGVMITQTFDLTIAVTDSQRLFNYRFQVNWTDNADYEDPVSEVTDLYPDILEEFTLWRGRDFKSGYSVPLASRGSLIVRNDDDQYSDRIDNRDLKPESRFQVQIDVDWITLWRGVVDNVEKLGDRPDYSTVEFQVLGILSNLVNSKISTSLETDIDISKAFTDALTISEVEDRWIGDIASTRDMALWWISNQESLEVLEVLERTEFGTAIEGRDGKIHLQSADHREIAARQRNLLFFSDIKTDRNEGSFDIIEANYTIPRWNVTNSIRVRIRKYNTSVEATLWSLEDPIEVQAGDTVSLIVEHEAGVAIWSDFVSGTDYTASMGVGGNTGRESDLTITTDAKGGELFILIENTSADNLWLRTLNVKGRALTDVNSYFAEEKDEDSIIKFGARSNPCSRYVVQRTQECQQLCQRVAADSIDTAKASRNANQYQQPARQRPRDS